MNGRVRFVGRGMVAGVGATAAMSAVMLGAQRAGLLGKMPPEKITETALDAAGVDRSERAQNALAAVAHVAYGVGSGALFAWIRTRSSLLPTPAAGALFATAVWAGSYFGWVPALGIMPSPPKDRPGRPSSMFVAHLVFGSVLGALLERGHYARPRRRPGLAGAMR